jgi:NFACT N-terminal and middle domains
LKFAKPESKHHLLVDSGFRCHLTSFARTTATTPSSFVAKLRKHLKSRRVTSVRQLGTDRILELTFTDGEYRLFLEFYAGGNVVLVDKAGVVLTALRIIRGGEGEAGACEVGSIYKLEERAKSGTLRERIEAALKDVGTEGEGGKWKKKQKKREGIKNTLATKLSEFSATLIEHCFRVVGVDIEIKPEEALASEEKMESIVRAFEEAERIVKSIKEETDVGAIKGYIIAKKPGEAPVLPAEKKAEKKSVSFGSSEAVEDEQVEAKVQEEGDAKGLVFDDFHPFLPKQFEDNPAVKVLEYQGFNHTVDTFVNPLTLVLCIDG